MNWADLENRVLDWHRDVGWVRDALERKGDLVCWFYSDRLHMNIDNLIYARVLVYPPHGPSIRYLAMGTSAWTPFVRRFAEYGRADWAFRIVESYSALVPMPHHKISSEDVKMLSEVLNGEAEEEPETKR